MSGRAAPSHGFDRFEALASDDARTLWPRGPDCEGDRWLVAVDVETGVVLSVVPEPQAEEQPSFERDAPSGRSSKRQLAGSVPKR